MKKDNYCLGLSKVQLTVLAQDMAKKINSTITTHNQKIDKSSNDYSKTSAFRKTKEAKALIEFYSINKKYEIYTYFNNNSLDSLLSKLASTIIMEDKALRTKLKIAERKERVDYNGIINAFILESTKGNTTIEALIKSLTDKYTK